MGADVVGAGTSEIVINGVKQEDLHPIEYNTIPDRIEAGTFMSMVAGTKGKAVIRNVYPAHLTFFRVLSVPICKMETLQRLYWRPAGCPRWWRTCFGTLSGRCRAETLGGFLCSGRGLSWS